MILRDGLAVIGLSCGLWWLTIATAPMTFAAVWKLARIGAMKVTLCIRVCLWLHLASHWLPKQIVNSFKNRGSISIITSLPCVCSRHTIHMHSQLGTIDEYSWPVGVFFCVIFQSICDGILYNVVWHVFELVHIPLSLHVLGKKNVFNKLNSYDTCA